jgi:ketosteroid isomerase-like protein
MEAGVDLFEPEIVFEAFMPDANERVVATGAAEVASFMQTFLQQWRDFRLFGDEFHDRGDIVLVTGRQTATGRQSGIAVEDASFAAWRFRDGMVSHLYFDRDRQTSLEAAGLSE